MARYLRTDTINALLSQRYLPVFNNSDPEKAKKIIKACYDGGCRIMEFTSRGNMPIETFRQLEAEAIKNMPGMILGTGSISDESTAALYMQYGSNFLVSQYFDRDTALICNKRKIPYIPGCQTVTEIHNAEAAGVEICKFFPARESGGPSFIKNVLGPSPWTRLLPMGGILLEEKDLETWFSAGAVCVGMGTKLIPSPVPDDFDYGIITANIEKVSEIIRKIYG